MSTRCTFISSRPNSKTANSPHGPAPIISTSVLIASLISLLFGWTGPAGSFLLRLSSQRGRGRKAINWWWRPGQPLAGIRQLRCKGMNIRRWSPVNAPANSDSTPRLEDFPYRLADNVRFADLDPNGHVNNAVYATYFETGRVTLMKDKSYWQLPEGLTWIMVRLDIHFRAELHWPGTIEMGLGVAKFGRTAVTFDQVVFSNGRCVASAQSVTVLIDEATRKPTPPTPEIIAKFQPWLRRGAALIRPAVPASKP